MLTVFGSVNADLVYQVESIPRPGETIIAQAWSFAAGGKGGNQAAAAAKAGGKVAFVGRVGDDEHGAILRRRFEEVGVDCRHLLPSSSRTGNAVIIVERSGENAIIVDSGANRDVDAAQLPPLTASDTLLCQNEVPLPATIAALRAARAAGARTILNLAPAGKVPDELLDLLDVLIVNEIEAATLVGSEGEPLALAKALAVKHGCSCVVTLGAQGAIAIDREQGWRIGSLKVHVVDTTGAGDAFVGVLAVGLTEGRNWQDALARASVAAGLACEKLGAREGHPSAVEIEARLSQLAPAQPI